MGSRDGGVITPIVPLVINGPPESKWNLVITCDGFTQTELTNGDFVNAANSFKTHFLNTAPFAEMAAAINVYRLDAWSRQSGADDPPPCKKKGKVVVANTFFDASFCDGGLHHSMFIDYARVVAAVKAALPAFTPGFEAIVVLVNSTEYGGRGELGVAVATIGNNSRDVALHEIGHLFGLGEEYQGTKLCHGPIEPSFPNLTVQIVRANLKTAWQNLVLSSTAIPTGHGTSCTGNPKNPAASSRIGTYEGGRTLNCCVYRPAVTCRMREVARPFCAVCQAQIVRRLSAFIV